MWRSLLLILLLPVCALALDDTANCSADATCFGYWTFDDSPGYLVDSTDYGHDLTNSGTVQHTDEAQGDESAYYDASGGATDYFTVANASLDADFPGMSGTSGDVSVTCFMKFNAAGGLASMYNSSTNNKMWLLRVRNNGGTYTIMAHIGYGAGEDNETEEHASSLSGSTWYFVGWSYDESSGASIIHVWDVAAGAIKGSDEVGTFTEDMDIGDTADLGIGCWFSSGSATGQFYGYLDAVTVWDRPLTVAEMTQIRLQTYWVGDGSGGRITRGSLLQKSNALARNCVGYWPMNDGTGGTVTDVSGNHPVGDLVNNVTWGATPQGGAPLFPTHAGSYINLNIPSTHPANVTGPFTWTARIYPEGNPQNSFGCIWNFRNENKNASIIDDGTFTAEVYIGGAVRSPTSADAIADDTVGHVALVYDGASIFWVVNGIKQTAGAISCTGAVYSLNFVSTVGAVGGENYGFNGHIWDVGVWNRALTIPELAYLSRTPTALTQCPKPIVAKYTSGGAPPATDGQVIMIIMSAIMPYASPPAIILIVIAMCSLGARQSRERRSHGDAE